MVARLLVTVLAFGVAALSTPLASRVARSLGVVDRPTERSVNRRRALPRARRPADAALRHPPPRQPAARRPGRRTRPLRGALLRHRRHGPAPVEGPHRGLP